MEGPKPIRKTEVEVRLGKLKNGKDEVTGKMIKGGGDRMVDWIWRLCNMGFESVLFLKTRSAVIFPLYKVKERVPNVRTIKVLACKKNICLDLSRQNM